MISSLSDIERRRIRIALVEDLGTGDVTSIATVPEDLMGRGTFLAKESGVVAGLDIAGHTFGIFETMEGIQDKECRMTTLVPEGTLVEAGTAIATIAGRMRTLLTAERVALNLLQRISGIATMTRRFVDAVAGTSAVILDTRKTAPLLRPFDRYGVRCGGGQNHRYGLSEMVLVKDNHIAASGGSIERVIANLRSYFAQDGIARVPVELEVTTLAQLDDVLRHGEGIIDRVMFDNFALDVLRTAVERNHGKFATEASGGVTLATVRAIAETGVDFISIGAITHSVKGFDISLEIEEEP